MRDKRQNKSGSELKATVIYLRKLASDNTHRIIFNTHQNLVQESVEWAEGNSFVKLPLSPPKMCFFYKGNKKLPRLILTVRRSSHTVHV